MLEPASIDELQSMVRAHDRVLPVGGRTKGRLSLAGEDCDLISTRQITGIIEYEPAEYTFTALAGTPFQEIHQAVRAKGQFLPCSTLLRESGATLGGAIASGLSGSGRFRFGGLRDFLLGIRFVSGGGEIITAGGKVVKNAAGFDLPKFMVGSLGRYGILTEVTLKVFPMPSAMLTLMVECGSHQQAVERTLRAASSRWELHAIDYAAAGRSLYLRLCGPLKAIHSIAAEITQEWPGQTRRLTDQESEEIWRRARELDWLPNRDVVIKVPVTPKVIPSLQGVLDQLDGVEVHYSVAGNVAFIAALGAGALAGVADVLRSKCLPGLTIIGGATAPLWLGGRRTNAIEAAVKHALDPQQRFPAITPPFDAAHD